MNTALQLSVGAFDCLSMFVFVGTLDDSVILLHLSGHNTHTHLLGIRMERKENDGIITCQEGETVSVLVNSLVLALSFIIASASLFEALFFL